MKGRVKWFNTPKGYGFIKPEQGDKEVFVHYTSIIEQDGFRDLRQGDAVEYELVDNGRGPAARSVRVVNFH